VRGISPEALDILLKYNWPGNIRELQNVLRQALLNTVGPVLLPEFLPAAVMSHESTGGGLLEGNDDLTGLINRLLDQNGTTLYDDAISALERYVLPRVLADTQGNISQSAKRLGITRGSLRNKIRALGLTIDRQIKIDENIADAEDAEVSA